MESKRRLVVFWAVAGVLFCVTAFLAYFSSGNYRTIDKWPEMKVESGYKEVSVEEQDRYKSIGYDYTVRSQNYDPFGDYLNYGDTKSYKKSDKIAFDAKGLPLVRYGDNFEYNPVTVSQFALSEHGKYIKGKSRDLSIFLAAASKLVEMQGDDGALRYDFEWTYYLTGETYDPGWVSGMAQGQALSVYARAYNLTKNKKYINAGNKALSFLVTRKSRGGVMSNLSDIDESLSNYIFFEEYLSTPNNYTLNGYMFSLLGLYDWARIEERNNVVGGVADEYFSRGVDTLVKLLPYYDIGGFSAYDLGHINFDKLPHVLARYHVVHINLLDALYSVTHARLLNIYSTIWKYYVE